MKKTYRTSIIITCHNYGRFLSWAIQSALHQTWKAKEILVINDSSSDETHTIANKYKDKIIYFSVDFSCAQKTRNFGISHSSGEYILFLDADDFLDNQFLEICEPELNRNHYLKLVYSGWYIFGDNSIIKNLKLPFVKTADNFDLQIMQKKNQIPITALFRKNNFAGFDPKIGRLQDWDAWLSYLNHEREAKCIENPLFHVRFHGNNKTISIPYYNERFKVLAKHNLIHLTPYSVANNSSHHTTTSSANIFIIITNPTTKDLFFEFERQDNINICGVAIVTNEHFAHIDSNLFLKTKPDKTQYLFGSNIDNILEKLFKDTVLHNTDWLIFCTGTELIKTKALVNHQELADSLIIVPDNFKWSDSLESSIFICFNRKAFLDFFSISPQNNSISHANNITRLKQMLLFTWRKYVGWRFKYTKINR